MKCENCKHNEATYHYRTNINGKVTEKHLCRECAEKAELSQGMFDSFDSMFDDMFGGVFGSFFGRRGMLSPFGGFGGGLAQRIMPRIDLLIDDSPAASAEAPAAAPAQESGVDPEMKKRRELNALRSQMDEAVKAEDFEKAAELRDKIHSLEKE